ncbi:MAG: HEPN domain-containing protein [Candidatus Micrarchaeia archaeon]
MKQGRIRKVPKDPRQAGENLAAAERDLAVAGKTLEVDCDWAFVMAYNAMLHAAMALMFAEGYAPSGEERHKIAVDYADAKLGARFGDLVSLFDRMRKKRHAVLYEKVGSISRYEAGFALKTAKEFVERIKEKTE